MGTQHLSLKWNNHQKNMLDVFEQLLQNEDLVDVTLACEGNTLKAHKTVLSACSSFFHNLFSEYPHKYPIVIMNDIKFSDLKIIVNFMYHGEVIVAHDQLGELVKTANNLKIKGLSEIINDGVCGTEKIFKADEEISSNAFNTSLAPTSTLNCITEQTHCHTASSLQKRRKRIRQQKRSSSISGDDQIPSNKIATEETDFIEIIEDENTILKSNNASSGISQSEISTFHSNFNVQSIHDIVEPSPSHVSADNVTIPSLRTVERTRILDYQTSDKNLQIIPETEFIIPATSLPEITPLQLVSSHSSHLMPSEILPATHILQENNKVDLPSQESSLPTTNIKVEETLTSNSCLHVSQQAEQRDLQGGYGTVAGNASIEEFFEEERQPCSYPRPHFLHQLASQQMLKNPINTTILTKKYKQQSYNLKNSKKRHHTCNICKKKFSDGSNLRRHLRIHSGQRPYSCDYCGRTFIQSTGLHRHKRSIHLKETQ